MEEETKDHPQKQTASVTAVLGIAVLVLVVVSGIVWGTFWIANVRNDGREARKETARLESLVKDLQKRQNAPSPDNASVLAQTASENYKKEIELQKQDLTDRLAARMDPVLRRLGDGQDLTAQRLDEARKELVNEIRLGIAEEQKQNQELRELLTKEQASRSQLQALMDAQQKSDRDAQDHLRQTVAQEQGQNQDLRKVVAEEQTSRAQLQGLMDAEQKKSHDLQGQVLTMYGIAERSLRMADELRLLYVQLAKRDSSALGATMETAKAPFKIVGCLFHGEILDSAKMEAKEKEIRARFESLCTELQSCKPQTAAEAQTNNGTVQ